MNVKMRLATVGLVLLGCATTAQSAATVYTISTTCTRGGNATCVEDVRYGNTSISSSTTYVPPDQSATGWNYAAEAAATASAVGFGLYTRAAGNTFDPNISGPLGMQAAAQVFFHDEVFVDGSGTGFIVVPWRVTGIFDLLGTSGGLYTPGGSFGVTFCQSIPFGSGSGGKTCTGGGSQVFTTSADYDQEFLLEYAIVLGTTYSLNTTFSLSVVSGAGLAVGMAADFSHTGLQQAARVYDSNRNLVLNPVIIAASGVDYLNPQASVVPAPPAAWLLATGVAGLAGRRWRRRSISGAVRAAS